VWPAKDRCRRIPRIDVDNLTACTIECKLKSGQAAADFEDTKTRTGPDRLKAQGYSKARVELLL
jgi:hypothetical protein